ncbi:hypothetical protein [Ruminococcus sp.]|uniref:hypothetical protein n=1 Tax=Ruminococcus sp. TaxID=41978 RepID=UPI0025FAA148|nr:hypothetical protein [Ruminococcus sp.]MBQ8967927.1 hypothetical protein [Ruminococcus sp.]
MKYDEYKCLIEEKQIAKEPDNYHVAKLKVYAPDESDLHEITLTFIKTMDHNGAWDFDLVHIDDENTNVITFKWNGGVRLLDALSKLPKFGCEHKKQLLLDAGREFDF